MQSVIGISKRLIIVLNSTYKIGSVKGGSTAFKVRRTYCSAARALLRSCGTINAVVLRLT